MCYYSEAIFAQYSKHCDRYFGLPVQEDTGKWIVLWAFGGPEKKLGKSEGQKGIKAWFNEPEGHGGSKPASHTHNRWNRTKFGFEIQECFERQKYYFVNIFPPHLKGNNSHALKITPFGSMWLRRHAPLPHPKECLTNINSIAWFKPPQYHRITCTIPVSSFASREKFIGWNLNISFGKKKH